MKHLLAISVFVSFAISPAAGQLKGGWIRAEYGYTNQTENTRTYYVTIDQYGSSRGPMIVRFWNATTGARVQNLSTNPVEDWVERATNRFSDCPNTSHLNNPYSIITTFFELTLPVSPDGYIVTVSMEGRDPAVKNIYGGGGIGILLRADIPGVIDGVDYFNNNSPTFVMKDTVSVCRNMNFNYAYKAYDNDGDSLSYSFGDAIDAARDTTLPPDFPVQYPGPFSGQDPFGTGVTIDPVTGVISGMAPDVAGGYNITVYVQEWRNGVLLNTARKESQIKITDCPFSKPLLKPLYSGCKQYSFIFKNEPTCPNITKWFWDFGVPGVSTDTSSLPTPAFTYPPIPGTYQLKLIISNDYGYIDSATTTVKIVDTISVFLDADTGICRTDSIRLNPITDGTQFLWRESGTASTLSSYTVKNPLAFPSAATTEYSVTARLDNCIDSAKIKVFTAPYPVVQAGPDTVLCFKGGVPISATTTAAIFSWSPSATLRPAGTLTPVAYPLTTTRYYITVRDTSHCKKPVTDSVLVRVIPIFDIDAGPDKEVALGVPFQLSATGDPTRLFYKWEPAQYFQNSSVYNPIGQVNVLSPAIIPFKVTVFTGQGCAVTDEILVKVFNLGPSILVPAAFTPNNDGNNDVLKPVLVGVQRLDYFKIYNRFGQLIFSTNLPGVGWDGQFKGILQSTGAYVYVVRGFDFSKKEILQKGTALLIR